MLLLLIAGIAFAAEVIFGIRYQDALLICITVLVAATHQDVGAVMHRVRKVQGEVEDIKRLMDRNRHLH